MKISMLKKRGIIFFINIGVVAVLTAGCAATAPKGKVTEDRKADEKTAVDLFLKGKMAEAKKSWAEAITAYTEALQYDTRSDEIAFALAKAYLMDGKIRSSLYYTKMAIRLNPSEAGYWQVLQYIEERENRLDEAAEALEMYLKLNPDHELGHYIKLSQYYFALGNIKEARKILLSRARDKYTTASEIYNIANLLASNGLTEEAVSLFENLIERDPLDVQAWFLLGDLYENTDREEEALQAYNMALEKNPDNLFLLVKIGNHCLMENDWNCAAIYFEKAYLAGSEKIESEGISYLEINRTLCAVYFYAGRDSDGIALYDSLRASGKDDSRLYFSLGKTMNYLDRAGEAVEYYRKGFEKDIGELSEDSLYNAYVGYARALIEFDRKNQALMLIRDEAKKHIKNTTILKELEASIYIKLEQYDDAISISEWLLASDPENRSHLLRLSLVYDMAGQFEQAEKALLKLLELSPDDPLALNNLAYMYLENNVNISKAMDMVQHALEAEPENGAYLDTLGWAYYMKGKYKQAKKSIEKALERADKEDKGIIYEHYGDVLINLGKKKEAIEAYRNAIEFGEDEGKIKLKIDSIEQ